MEVKSGNVAKYFYVLFVVINNVIQSYEQHLTDNGKYNFVETTENRIIYKTLYYMQPVDHFAYGNADSFSQRYLLADQYWDHNGGPIFLYAGNEGDIAWFCNNTGLMWDWAPEFKAMLVFAEHRYYGESLPYGNDSFKDPKHSGYLSTEQAMADFAQLLQHLKATVPNAANSPVVVFGGSYGGMLAAWFRMKYPHMVAGALAASAPIWQFPGLIPCGVFNQITTKDFQKSGKHCAENIRKSWAVINKMASTAAGRGTLAQSLRLCKPLKTDENIKELKFWLTNTWTNLAMVDYPYPANFLMPLPAWPIKTVCSYLGQADLPDAELLRSLGQAINVYYNYTGESKCFSIVQQATSDLGDAGWDFQSCTEMVMPMCADGVNDMFEKTEWNMTAETQRCQKKWGVTPRPDWAVIQYGGKDITAASNIIFSNGRLDPWSSGGVMTSLSKSLHSIVIEEGAHHLDLRSANPADPASVKQARQKEKQIIVGWIREFANGKLSKAVPTGYLTPPSEQYWNEDTNPYIFISRHKTKGGLTKYNVPIVIGIMVMMAAFLVYFFVISKRQKCKPRGFSKSTKRPRDEENTALI